MENNKQTNTIAIVGFILSFFIGLAGLVCSIIGLVKSKEFKNGKGLSIAGIIISSLRLLFCLLLIFIFFNIAVKEVRDELINRIDINNKYEYKTEEKRAYELVKDLFEKNHRFSEETYSYNYIGVYKNSKLKKFYVFDIRQLVNSDHLSSIGYYAVSLEDNDYYFIINSPEFLDTGIIDIELKVYES